MKKRFWLHVLLLGIGLLAALLACEITLQVVALVGKKSKAPASGRPIFYYKQNGSPSMQNFRYAVPKPPEVFRIAAIGDSFTYPHLLQFDDAYSQRLARIINLSQPEGGARRTEVINYGVAGYSTELEIGLVKRALDEGADLVLLQITLNDPAADGTIADFRRRYPGRYGALAISPQKTPLLYYFKTLGWLASRWHNLLSHHSYIRYHQVLFENSDTWNSFSSSILRIQQLCAERRAAFAAFTFPIFTFPLDKNYPFAGVHRKIDNFLSDHNIPHLDLLKAYWHVPPRLLHVTATNSHPNEIAHRVAAEHLYLWLTRRGLIPEELRSTPLLSARYPSPKPFTEKAARRLPAFKGQRE